MKNKEARISKSIYSNTFTVEECCGGTLYYSHFDTYSEAVEYCNISKLTIID